MLTRHLALINKSSKHSQSTVMAVAAALQKQIVRDFFPVWGIPATVTVFDSEEELPIDYWKIIIADEIGYNGSAGIHLDESGQPFALIDADEEIGIVCSHEALEMLVDPFGRTLVAGPSPLPGQGRVNFLVEVCDPSEAYTYTVNGIRVSDFYTPAYFAPELVEGTRFSFLGKIKSPRQVLPGGYLSWMAKDGTWWQLQFFEEHENIVQLDSSGFNEHRCWREHIDRYVSSQRKK